MNKCGDCVFLEKDDGTPYCLTLPLYTERDLEEDACECFVGVMEGDDDERDAGGYDSIITKGEIVNV